MTTSFARFLVRGLVMRGDVLGLERRRRWSEEDKARIVSSVGVGGVTVTQLAHHHAVTRQQIHAWRNELKKKGMLPPSGVAFLPVDLAGLQGGPVAEDRPVAPAIVNKRRTGTPPNR